MGVAGAVGGEWGGDVMSKINCVYEGVGGYG